MTDICLFTTTIHNPTVLRQYRAADPDVLMIIAGDLRTPHDEVKALCDELGHAVYLDPPQQERMGYQCSDVLGWATIQRRNIALLEAIRSGANVVLSIDDDNAPRYESYFLDLRAALARTQALTVVRGGEWFNLGAYADEPFFCRGYPFSRRAACERTHVGALEPVMPGIVNGYIYGDPDINAIDRYPGGGPRVIEYNGHSVAINPRTTWAPINSQNTAYVRALAPLAFVLPGIGRYDDIWASYMALRVMEATDYHVLFGEPSVVQERNPHDWLVDLERELYGMKHTEAFCASLKAVPVTPAKSVLDNLAAVAAGAALLPEQARRFLDAWNDDVARVL